MIQNKVTITGTGTIIGKGESAVNGANATYGSIGVMSGGLLELSSGVTVTSAVSNTIVVWNGGTLISNGATISCTSTGSWTSPIYLGSQIGTTPDYGNKYPITCTITGGSITSAQERAIDVIGYARGVVLNISDAEIKGADAEKGCGIYFAGNGSATITNSTIRGGIGIINVGGNITLSNTDVIGTQSTAGGYGSAVGNITPSGIVQSINGGNYNITKAQITINGGSVTTASDQSPLVIYKNGEKVQENSGESDGNKTAAQVFNVSSSTEFNQPVDNTYTPNLPVQLKNTDPETGKTTYSYYPDVDQAQQNATDGSVITSGDVTSYVVTFNANGGSFSNGTSSWKETVESGIDVTFPTSPTRNGYDFTGWTNSDGEVVTSPFKVTESVTLYAAWQRSVDSGNNGSSSGNTTPTPPTPPENTEPGPEEIESVTKPDNNGGYTTGTVTEDGITSDVVQNSQGTVTEAEVTIPSQAISNGTVSIDLGTNSITGDKLAIRGDITSTSSAPELTINLPESTKTVNVEIELVNGTGLPGTVAMIENEDGSLSPIINSVVNGEEIIVPLSGSQKIIIKDNSKTFTDVSANQWYDDAVAFVSARDIMNGSAGEGSTTFAPNETLTRAMLAQMIANMDGQPNTSKETNPWYLGAQRYVMSKELMGVNSPFNPDDPISRQDLALVLWRNAGSPSVNTSVLDEYADRGQVSSYATQGVAWAVKNGILGVNSPLNPTSEATRAEVARMLMAFITDQLTK